MKACPLDLSDQTRNLWLFATCTGLIYLCAPVLYVGTTQASLCSRLGGSVEVSNRPAAAFFALTVTPVFVAWLSPFVATLKRNLVLCFVAQATILAAVVVTLLLPLPRGGKVAVVVLQGAVCGATMPTAIALLWEAIGRGVAESRRGTALGLAYGLGPVLAVLGSLAEQLCLSGSLGSFTLAGLEYPRNFVVLFGMAVPEMLAAAFMASRLVIPLPQKEAIRESFGRSVLGGLREFLTDRVLFTATIVTVLVYTGNAIISNMNLHTVVALGQLPQNYAGFQNALRFAFKVVAGVLLGWLVTRTNPKAGVVATSCLFVASQVWAIVATGTWYLVAFGLYGAGELIGVYAPNYILSASRPSQIRRNMALVSLMMAPAAFEASLFGVFVDHVRPLYGPAVAFRASFAACAGIMMVGLLIAVLFLPARPRPDGEGENLLTGDFEL
jgi:hypothetical protein